MRGRRPGHGDDHRTTQLISVDIAFLAQKLEKRSPRSQCQAMSTRQRAAVRKSHARRSRRSTSVGWFRAATRITNHPTSRMSSARMISYAKLAAGPMVVPFILDRQHQVGPSHVEVIPATAVGAAYRDLRLRSRISVANHQQPQPCFLRRLGARVDEIERRFQLPQAPCVWMARCDVLDGGDLQLRGPGQGVQTSDRIIDPSATPQVERRTLRRRDDKSVQLLNFVVQQQLIASDDAVRRPSFRPDQLDR